ncbi:Geranylgeranyl transferase type-2 subunit alpha 1 [Camellia lanceoleosa]|uniref:Geranylgeranyl transferase type-2 subunit alpha 1 n=1 Tax=Camellia lanceoleosa TaxID=1840588 RepID=A0ACC0FZ97_9ERIC|nr:Geranylgeranyl transferase type-2 subunit alpha 1 [Camellia lanceoleosa]
MLGVDEIGNESDWTNAGGASRDEEEEEEKVMAAMVKFMAALKNRSDEEELHFTTDLINENFSNYSSWHNRSVILSHLLEKRAQGSFSKEKVLIEEYDLVHQALFTNPDDQSGWFYHLWLLEQTVKVENPLLVLPGHLMVLILMYQQMVSWILVLHLLSQGIVSLSGFHPCLPTHFEFTVSIQPHGSQHAEMESAEMISWGDENFHTGETHLQEPTQIKNFDQLRNSEMNESTASKWSAETIVNEIALFPELLSEINWYVEFIHE